MHLPTLPTYYRQLHSLTADNSITPLSHPIHLLQTTLLPPYPTLPTYCRQLYYPLIPPYPLTADNSITPLSHPTHLLQTTLLPPYPTLPTYCRQLYYPLIPPYPLTADNSPWSSDTVNQTGWALRPRPHPMCSFPW